MSIDLDQVLMSLDGKPLKQEKEDAKFRDVVCAALGVETDRVEGAEKYKRFQLMVKLVQATSPLTLKTEEKALIKAHIGKTLPAIFVGRIYDIIDPPDHVD